MYTKENVIGQIHFITIMGREISFDVMDDYKLICRTYDFGKAVDIIIIKPNLDIIFDDRRHIDLDIIRRQNNTVIDYVMQVSCDEELFDKLVLNDSIKYSTDMSYLYGLNSDYAYDLPYNTRAFKHVKDKTKILEKQKNGMFR